MKHMRLALAVGALMAAGPVTAAPPTEPPVPRQWGGCCGIDRWTAGPGMMWPENGSMPRHHLATMWGVPSPYGSFSNPLPRSHKTVKRGAAVYTENCASCHGAKGAGDGAAGRGLRPPPGDLAWLSEMPIAQWDPFMYWTVAEGGAQFGTAMPAFKEVLGKDDIWAVIAYIQARLPQKPD